MMQERRTGDHEKASLITVRIVTNHGDGPVDPQIEGESKLGRNAEGVRLPNRNPFLFRKLLHFA
jgi:hypothetical protein